MHNKWAMDTQEFLRSIGDIWEWDTEFVEEFWQAQVGDTASRIVVSPSEYRNCTNQLKVIQDKMNLAESLKPPSKPKFTR